MRKGINQWCFPETWSLDQMITEAARAGFDGLELNLSAGAEPGATAPSLVSDLKLGEVPGLTLRSTPADARRIAEQARSRGLAIPSIATALHWQFPLTDPEEGGKGKEIVRRMMELAEAAGAATVLVVPGLVTEQVPYDVAYDRAVEALADLAQAAAAHRVVIGVENVWNRFLLSPLEFRTMLDAVGSPWVKAYLDCGNVLINGFPDQWIRILGHRVASVHVKDFRLSVGNIHGFAGLLEGDVNWPAVQRALAEVRYEGYITMEVPPPTHFATAALQRAAQAMRLITGD